MENTVLITNKVPVSVTEPVKGLATVRMGGSGHSLMTREEVLAGAQDCVGIVNQAELRVDEALLEALPRLKVVANISVGIDNLDIEAMARYGVWATNAPDYFRQPVAEYVIGALIYLSRGMKSNDAFVRSGQWDAFEPGRWDGFGLAGRTLCVIGYGRIGRILADYARALGMRVIAYQRNDGVEKLHSLLRESDYLSVHVPLLPETRGLIGPHEFAVMKPGVILANASRGGVVDEPAMIDALQRGKLGGAMVDVFAHEPKVPEALRAFPNVLLSPHVCGGTIQSREQGRLCAFRNIAAVLRGETPPNALNCPTKNT